MPFIPDKPSGHNKRTGFIPDSPSNVDQKTLHPSSIEEGLGEKVGRHLGEGVRQLGRTGRMVATGISGLADVPNIAALPLYAAGLKETPYFYEPIAGKVQGKIDDLTGGKLKARNKAEEWVDWIGESMAPLSLAPFTGGSSLTGLAANQATKALVKAGAGKAARKAATLSQYGSQAYAPTAKNIGANLGSAVTSKAYLDNNRDPSVGGALLSSALGGMLGAPTGSFVRGMKNPIKNYAHPFRKIGDEASYLYGKSKGFSPEKYKAYDELGISPTLGMVTNKKTTRAKELELANSSKGMNFYDLAHQKLSQDLARNFGASKPQDLKAQAESIRKEIAKEGAQAYDTHKGDLYDQKSQIFAPRVKEFTENRKLVDMSDFLDHLNDGEWWRKTEAEKASLKRTPKGKYIDRITDAAEQEARNNPTVPGKNISYGHLDDLRQEAMLDSRKPMKSDIEKNQAKDVYYNLAGKRHEFMEKHGNAQERKNAREARALWDDYKNPKKSNMYKYVKKITESSSDTEAFDKIYSKDPKYTRAVVDGLKFKDKSGATAREFTESFITYLGIKDGKFDPRAALPKLQRIKKDKLETLNAGLEGFKPQEKEVFTKTMDLLSDRKAEFDQLYNTSRSAYVGKDLALDKKLAWDAIASLWSPEARKSVIVNLMARTGEGFTAAKFTSPKFLKRIDRVMKAKSEKELINSLNGVFKSPIGRATVKGSSFITKTIGRLAPHIKDLKHKQDLKRKQED